MPSVDPARPGEQPHSCAYCSRPTPAATVNEDGTPLCADHARADAAWVAQERAKRAGPLFIVDVLWERHAAIVRERDEQAGDVEQRSTPSDAAGRQQPARKPKRPRRPGHNTSRYTTGQKAALIAEARRLLEDEHYSRHQAYKQLGIGYTTLCRWLDGD